MAKKITPQQLRDTWRTIPSLFDVNVCNFLTNVAGAGVDVFQKSFYLHRFNTSGSFAWKKRRDRKKHPVLVETGTLRNSITKKTMLRGKQRKAIIYTDKDAFMSAKRHRGFCYADIHNAESGTYTYGNTGVPSIQRQFMGHSTTLDRYIEKYGKQIFEGFP